VHYAFTGSFRTHPGRGGEFATRLAEGAPALRAAGCLTYLVAQAAADPDLVVVFEVWPSKQEHDDSLQRPEVQAAIAALRPLLTGEFSGRELGLVGGLGLPADG